MRYGGFAGMSVVMEGDAYRIRAIRSVGASLQVPNSVVIVVTTRAVRVRTIGLVRRRRLARSRTQLARGEAHRRHDDQSEERASRSRAPRRRDGGRRRPRRGLSHHRSMRAGHLTATRIGPTGRRGPSTTTCDTGARSERFESPSARAPPSTFASNDLAASRALLANNCSTHTYPQRKTTSSEQGSKEQAKGGGRQSRAVSESHSPTDTSRRPAAIAGTALAQFAGQQGPSRHVYIYFLLERRARLGASCACSGPPAPK